MHIDGTINKSFADVISAYCNNTYDMNGIIQEIFDGEPLVDDEMFQKVIGIYRKDIAGLVRLKGDIEEDSALSEQLFKLYKLNPYPKYKDVNRINKKLDLVDDKLKKASKEICLVAHIMQPFISSLSLNIRDNELPEQENNLAIVSGTKQMYLELLKAIDFMQETIDYMVKEGIYTMPEQP